VNSQENYSLSQWQPQGGVGRLRLALMFLNPGKRTPMCRLRNGVQKAKGRDYNKAGFELQHKGSPC
jgi:hypothetical protein